MSTPVSPDPDPLRSDHQGVDDVASTPGAPTSPGRDSTDVGPTTGDGTGAVNVPDTGPGPAAADVDQDVDREVDRDVHLDGGSTD